VYQIESYLHYQGDKLVRRFDANTYLAITRVMDAHDLGAGRGSREAALASITCPALCVGVSSDILYPAHEQREIAAGIPGGCYREITSPHGHDAFLIEYGQLTTMVREFLQEVCPV
jgi:homoserine O-acetyltransferase